LSSWLVRGSSISKEAKSDGNARARVVFKKIGRGAGEERGFSRVRSIGSFPRLLFMANFESLGSLIGGSGTTWPPEDENGAEELIYGLEGDTRLIRDWYDVVMAVVAVGPFAIGVRYSVRGGGKL